MSSLSLLTWSWVGPVIMGKEEIWHLLAVQSWTD